MTEKLPYSGQTSAYEHKHGDAWKENKFAGAPAVTTIKLINAQWSNMPVEVEAEVKELWRYCELGNDHYYWEGSISDMDEMMGSHEDNGEEDEEFGIEVEHWVSKQPDNPDDDHWGWKKKYTTLPYFRQWLEEQGFEYEEKFLLHWWW